jgi:VWFA-related protein
MNRFTQIDARIIAVLLTLSLLAPAQTTQPAASNDDQSSYRIRVNSDLVLVNLVVRDKKGNLIRGLTQNDFTLSEDGKSQKISSFDFENVDELIRAGAEQPTVTGTAGPIKVTGTTPVPRDQIRNRRLIVLFFDFTGMETDEIDRSVDAALRFVDKQMTPADLVSLVSLSSSLQVDQDFTSDKQVLSRKLHVYNSSEGQGLANGTEAGTAEGTAETGGSYVADDSDFNQFNTDRKLQALQALIDKLGRIEQKKSIIYFSNGVSRSGIENQTTLRAATNSAVRANVSIYPMDIRGLEAMPPGGLARNASVRGVSAYSGQSVLDQFNSNASTQETLTTLAADTGGKAFLDSNDFNQVFTKVQDDTSSYYVLGYRSNNPAMDGRFRRIKVQVNRSDVKLEYRSGYYAPKDYQHFNREDKEQQMQDEIASELTTTDVAVYVSAAYFRLDDSHYYIPVSLIVPGSQIPFTNAANKDKATIDIIGTARNELNMPIGNVRETVKLNIDESQQVRRKNVQYNTGFVLAPGVYKIKFVVRENQTGRLGSFESTINVPDLKKAPLKLSSIVLSNQRAAASKHSNQNPLVRDGSELIPNITHVFSPDQHLYMQFEVYDPAREKKEALAASAANNGQAKNNPPPKQPKNPVHVLTNIVFLQGKVKAYETPLVEAREINAPERKAAVFQLDVPLAQLKPGLYTCQVNVIDDAAGSFSFPRIPILIRLPASQQTASAMPSGK